MCFDYMRCLSCQQDKCIDCRIQHENFKYIVKYTNIRKYWSLFNLIISVSTMDANGYFTLNMASDIIKTENLNDITPRNFWEVMAYFLSRVNYKLHLDRESRKRNAKSTR